MRAAKAPAFASGRAANRVRTLRQWLEAYGWGSHAEFAVILMHIDQALRSAFKSSKPSEPTTRLL